MKLIDAVDYLRKNILHDTGGHRVDYLSITEDSDEVVLLRWTNESLTTFIQEALDQVYRRILPAHGFYTDLDIQVLPGQSEYELDPRILRVFSGRLLSSKRDLTLCDLQDLSKGNTDFSFLDKTDNPTNIIPDYTSGTIRIFPTPDYSNEVELDPIGNPGVLTEIGEQLTMLVNRLPLKRLKWSSNSTKIELREELIVNMLHYAAHKAYLLDEANTLDVSASERHLAYFEREFPSTSAYSDVRKRRATRNQVRYRGLF